MDRKWLIRATGRTANEIPTELMINATGLLTDPPICYLLVDRSGTGNFAGEQTEYILYDSITEQGQVYFKNLQWDTDDSGQDSYSFSLGYFKNETLIAGREDETAYFTNTDIQQKFKSVQGDFLKNATITALPEHGELKLNGQPVNIGDNLPLEEPAKFSFEPSPDWNGKTKLSWKGLVDYSLSGLPGLSVASIEGDVVINIVPENDLPLIDHIIAGTEDDLLLNFTITDFSDVFTDVDGDKLAWVQIRELPENGTLSLNGIPLEVDNKIIKEKLSQMIYTAYDDKLLYDSFLWNASDGIAYADSSKRAGMVLADKEKLQSNGGGMSALVYPNPAKELFRLTVLLENESGILLEIFNSKGQTVLIKNESDQSKTLFNYEFNGFEPGVYFIKIKTQSQFQSLKLIVE